MKQMKLRGKFTKKALLTLLWLALEQRTIAPRIRRAIKRALRKEKFLK